MKTGHHGFAQPVFPVYSKGMTDAVGASGSDNGDLTKLPGDPGLTNSAYDPVYLYSSNTTPLPPSAVTPYRPPPAPMTTAPTGLNPSPEVWPKFQRTLSAQAPPGDVGGKARRRLSRCVVGILVEAV